MSKWRVCFIISLENYNSILFSFCLFVGFCWFLKLLILSVWLNYPFCLYRRQFLRTRTKMGRERCKSSSVQIFQIYFVIQISPWFLITMGLKYLRMHASYCDKLLEPCFKNWSCSNEFPSSHSFVLILYWFN